VKKVFIIAILFFAGQAFSQSNCLLFDMSAREPVFRSGEKITYTLSYTVMGIWTNVGEAEFQTTLKKEKNRPPFYHIDANGKTFSFFDKVFRVRDNFVSRIDAKTLQPFYMQRNVNEGGYRRKSVGNFRWANGVIHTSTQRLDKQQPEKRDTLHLTPCTFDVVSLFYYYRCCDFSKIKKNTTYNVNLAMDDKVYTINYKLHGREKQKVKGIGKFNTLKFSATLIEGEVFTGEEQIFFWVTDDENRIPVYIEIPIIVGSIRARISKWENLKFPLDSKIQE
jgi:hypothetical protein